MNYNKLKLKKLWIMIIPITVVLIMSTTMQILNAEINLKVKRLYIYSHRELSIFFKEIGYPELWYNDISISRNSDGTALRFLNKNMKKFIIVTCDGTISVMDSPGYPAWLNDTNQVVTWFDDKSNVDYANGMSEKRPFSPIHGPDPSGKYFIKERLGSSPVPLNESCFTSIYATEKPDIPLAKVDICGATKIFYKDKNVFLTGRQYHDDKWQGEEIRVFREKGNVLEAISNITVLSPNKSDMLFYAVDLSPWDDEMLFIDFHDFPSRSIWYSFNYRSHKLNKVGKVPWFGGWAFYLQCDIVKNALKKN